MNVPGVGDEIEIFRVQYTFTVSGMKTGYFNDFLTEKEANAFVDGLAQVRKRSKLLSVLLIERNIIKTYEPKKAFF